MNTIKVVVGILRNHKQQILISKRQNHQFMPDFWELPGGKIKQRELPKKAIIRELKEELGIVATHLSIHKNITHQYSDRLIKLSIFNIHQYQQTPQGIEGQKIIWSDVNNLSSFKLLPTMKIFINSITLPNKYWITPSLNHQSCEWMAKFDEKINQGISLIQLRSKTTLNSHFITELYNKCQQHNIKLLLNTIDKSFNENYCDGWHITTAEMLALVKNPILKKSSTAKPKILGVSTHCLKEALMAQNLGADFIVISPIQATQTHPNATPLGWKIAQEVVKKINIPVYFLGGMGLRDLIKALKLNAQGIAGVSAF
jgi:8-oxo-dGTP diphosphatase